MFHKTHKMLFEQGKSYWGSKPRFRTKITVVSRTDMFLKTTFGNAAIIMVDGNECARTNSGYTMRSTDVIEAT